MLNYFVRQTDSLSKVSPASRPVTAAFGSGPAATLNQLSSEGTVMDGWVNSVSLPGLDAVEVLGSKNIIGSRRHLDYSWVQRVCFHLSGERTQTDFST